MLSEFRKDVDNALHAIYACCTTNDPVLIRQCACAVHTLVTGLGKYVHPKRTQRTNDDPVLVSKLYELRHQWRLFAAFKIPKDDPCVTDHCAYLFDYLTELIRVQKKKSLKQGYHITVQGNGL